MRCLRLRQVFCRMDVIGILISLFLLVLLIFETRSATRVLTKESDVMELNPVSKINMNVYLQQRVNMSRRMNSMMQVLAKQSCAITDEKIEGHGHIGKKNSRIALTGGWCKSESMEGHGHHLTDKGLLQALNVMFTKKRVGSFGDGPGVYKRELLKMGKVKAYDAYDGAPFCEETSEGRVKYMDLTVPQYGVPIYDWVLSLEVAEHIPEEHEDQVINNIVRHAREGVVLSWATPGQGGTGHINLRTHDYVIKKFQRVGFTRDIDASKEVEKKVTFTWFKAHPPWNKDQKDGNIHVFKRNADNPVDPLDA